ncbi:MAG: leucine-rich repeat domain-containing protein [Treponema sp.]|nr:leucine-rich repeat domain-containing protein [Treponema sp.]
MKKITLGISCLTVMLVLFTKCYWGTTDISGAPNRAIAWKPLRLEAEVSSNSFLITPNIIWSIKNAGTTQARIVNNEILFATAPGTLVVRASIENTANIKDNFTKDFTITVHPAPEEIHALGTLLISHNENTAENPILLNASLNLEVHWENLRDMLIVASRYVYLNLTESTGTAIPHLPGFADRHFYNYNVLSIILPDSITGIGSYAFSQYERLKSINMGNNIAEIGNSAFYHCREITEIIIPDSVIKIGDSAFNGCTGLTSVIIGNNVDTIGDYAFNGCSNLGSIIIPDSVTSIGNSAFSGCSGLTSVSIGNNVAVIGNSAFSGCENIPGITIPDSVTSIGHSVFNGCNSLAAIHAAPGNTMFSSTDGVLYNKTATSLIRYPAGKTTEIYSIQDGVTSIENEAFRNCSSLISVIIPDSVITIGNFAFSGCTAMTSITIPDNVVNVGDSAFSGCIGLISISLPDNVVNIGAYAFYNCRKLSSINLGNSITTIRTNTFGGCTDLTGITFPESVTTIENSAFISCSNFTGIFIGKNITFIGEHAFWGNIQLTSVTFEGAIPQTGLPDSAFPGDLRLKYFANSGGPGTYNRSGESDRWNKIY